jgi:flagella basal body P-ring formation protein FlgA
VLLAASFPVLASPLADSVLDFAARQTRGLPGRVEVILDIPDAKLGPCQAYDPFLPGNARLWGKATIGVRCLGPSNWTVFIPVQIRVHAQYVRTVRPLSLGQPVSAEDVELVSGDLAEFPDSILTDPGQAVGRPPRVSLASGQALRDDHLIVVPAVRQGQTVKLISKGPGFTVSSEGTALANAAAGQSVRVRGNSGQTLSGIARPGGIVEINY